MNTQENFAPKNNGPENPGRRGFIRGTIAGLAGLTLAATGVNKYIEKEREEELKKSPEEMNIDELYVYFGKDVENFEKANHAAYIVLQEMNNPKMGDKKSVDRISIKQGINFFGFAENERLAIAKDFLVRHLNSKAGHKHDVHDREMRKNIFATGFITRQDLVNILSNTTK